MLYRTKVIKVSAFRFSGTLASAREAKDWVSNQDITDVDVSWQGSEPLGLDIITDRGLRTLEAGDWLVSKGGKLSAETADDFKESYEEVLSE